MKKESLAAAQRQMWERKQKKEPGPVWTGFGCLHTGGPEPCPRNTEGACRVNLKLRRMEQQYGVYREDILAMLDRQGKCCAICRKSFVVFVAAGTRKAGWVPDHCHKTGKVRAILCHFCNVKLGLYGDDPELLERAAAYLRKHGAPVGPK